MENLQNHLIKKEKRKEALDLELQKIKKENKGLNLELLSLNNKLSIFSEKSLKRKQKVCNEKINLIAFFNNRNKKFLIYSKL